MKHPEEILSLSSVAELRTLKRRDFEHRRMTDKELRHIFKLCDAIWLHSGNPEHPHAELTKGNCSTGFVNVMEVLRHTNLCEIFAGELVKLIYNQPSYKGFKPFDWVVGSDHAGAALSYEVARQLGAQHDFTEKDPCPENAKRQSWKRHEIQPNERILQVEELITTTSTLQEVRNGLRWGMRDTLDFFPFVVTLIHRSAAYEFEGAPILYLAHFDIETWDPDKCPLCEAGSKRLRPKANWAELIAANAA